MNIKKIFATTLAVGMVFTGMTSFAAENTQGYDDLYNTNVASTTDDLYYVDSFEQATGNVSENESQQTPDINDVDDSSVIPTYVPHEEITETTSSPELTDTTLPDSTPITSTDNPNAEIEPDSNLVTTDTALITSYVVNFKCVLDGWPRNDYAVFNIYTEDGNIVDSHTRYISDTEDFSLNFNVPSSPVGTIFYLEVSGINSIDYYSTNYAVPTETRLPLYTYWSDSDENGEKVPVSSAYMTAHVRTQPQINLLVDGNQVSLSSPAIFDGSSIIAPLSEIAEAIGITDCTYFPEYNSVRVETGDNIMYVNVGYSYATMYDNDIYFNVPTSNINSLTYIEVRPFVQAFGSTLDFNDYGSYCEINLTKSPMAINSISELEERVNNSGVSSSTDYLIWVNKEKFRCSVFSGYKGNWKWIKDFTVGIGANGSETITGVFEYNDYTTMWPYSSYYVGPVMVFYGNYALHSTFLRYDGTPYDNTVGAKISHGCVRCQAKYINWMASNLPMHTTVYVTEQ